jgi:C4-dicarboxylate-binding protein DctP
MKEVTESRNAEVTKIELQNKDNIIKTGSEVRELTPEQRAAWVDAMKPVWAKFEGDIGADVIKAAVSYNTTN